MSIFVLKLIACITMVIDHIRYAIPFPENIVTSYFGRIAFPLFAFLITEGYSHTKDLKKYYKRLFIFGLVSQIPFMLFRTLVGEWKMLNIMFTLILGLSAITIYDKIEKKYLSIPLSFMIICLGELLNVDYGWFGVATVFVIYIFKNKKINLFVSYFILLIVYFYSVNMLILHKVCALYFLFYLIPVVFMVFYNGKKGKSMKYFFYWFYPIHMLIIYGISFLF